LLCRLGFGGIALYRVGSADLEVRKRTGDSVPDYSPVVDDFLEFGSSFATLMCGQKCFPAHVDGTQSERVSTAIRDT